MIATAQHAVSPRRGVTLLELLVVVVLIGIFSTTVAMRFGRSIFGEFGAHATARELSLALLTCQRAAISTGDDHYVEFLYSGGDITQYRIMRDVGGTPTLVDGPKALPSEVTVTSSASTLHYNFQGSALSAYWIVLTGNSRVWRIDVVPITGTFSITQTS
jgi:prepilin-type N-terminal cleavage/methylation domain-containing protein